MTPAEESFINHVLGEGGVFDQLNARLPEGCGLVLRVRVPDGLSWQGRCAGPHWGLQKEEEDASEVAGATEVDVGKQASDGEAVGGGDAEGQAAPEASEEVDEAPMSKGKRKK